MNRLLLLSLWVIFVVVNVVSAADSDFALHDGDTVVFMGDSITAARGYSKLVEQYTLLRFPARQVRFVNAGQGGDTMAGGLQRLDRDVFSKGATVLTVAFGINDIGWGMKADAGHKQIYLDAVRGIAEACQRHKVRLFLCSPAITAEDPDKAEQGFLQKMTDEGLALAKSLGADTIDLQRGMREIQRRIVAANARETEATKKTTLHVADGIHLNDLGQLAMAYALLKGLGAPAGVSSVVIDFADGALQKTEGCRVSEILKRDGGLEFVREDEGLPLNLGALGGLNFRFISIPEGLNRYLLTVASLPAGDFELLVEGRVIGKASAGRLGSGLNISSMTTNGWEPGGPWDAQASLIKELTEARDRLAQSEQLRNRFLTNHPHQDRLDRESAEADARIVTLQRESAHPFPYHFRIQPVGSVGP